MRGKPGKGRARSEKEHGRSESRYGGQEGEQGRKQLFGGEGAEETGRAAIMGGI